MAFQRAVIGFSKISPMPINIAVVKVSHVPTTRMGVSSERGTVSNVLWLPELY